MISAPFQYHRANSLNDAVRLLGQHGEEAKLLAGGHSLIPLLKLRLAQPAHIIDISRIHELSGIKQEGDRITVGALTTHSQIESSELLKSKCPLLVQTAQQIGDVQVRNKGTIGGAASHADPASDYPAALLALEAEFIVQGATGQKTIKAEDFFVGMLTTALSPNEILTTISLPSVSGGTGASYQKFAQKASGFAICGVAALITVQNGKCTRARIAVNGVTQKAYRARAAEQALEGKAVGTNEISSASNRATDEVEDFLGDIHASQEYRKELTRVYARRAIEAAIAH